MIAGFRRHVNEICILLGFYATQNGSFLLTFRDKISGPTSPETSARNYHFTLREIPKKSSDLSAQVWRLLVLQQVVHNCHIIEMRRAEIAEITLRKRDLLDCRVYFGLLSCKHFNLCLL